VSLWVNLISDIPSKVLPSFSQTACVDSRYTVTHIPTESGSDNVQGLIVVLVFCQLSSGCNLEHCEDDVCFLYNLPNGMALAHEIVVSLVFPITEILAIEDNELHDTFIHITFESQSRLRTMSYLTRSDTN
jgi:hypothetical protein